MKLDLNEEFIKTLNNEYKVDFNKAEIIDFEVNMSILTILIKCKNKYFIFNSIYRDKHINAIQEIFENEINKITSIDDVDTAVRGREYLLVFNLKDNYELTKLYRDDVSYKKILKTTKDVSVFKVNSL